MHLEARETQRILLFTLIALAAPMFVFPEKLGMDLLIHTSLIYIFYEMVYYGFMAFLLKRSNSLVQISQSAGICLVYRLAMGAALGILIAAAYNMKISISVKMAMASYLPAVLFQIALTPFILKPVINRIHHREPRRRVQPQEANNMEKSEMTPPPPPLKKKSRRDRKMSRTTSKPQPVVMQDKPVEKPFVPTGDNNAAFSEENIARISPDINGFERAVRYIGEHASVYLATVVDHEGLLLANFKRGNLDPEAWAPLALVFYEQNCRVLDRAAFNAPEKIDLVLKDNRLVIARIDQVSLMVIAERQTDDFLNIRINQAMETIKRYLDERYGKKTDKTVESINVSGTE